MIRVQAENHAESSENRIHSDEIAQRLGFTGALVPGVAVYGYMARAFADEAFLGSSTVDVRFLKPAYAGDWLEISSNDDAYRCHNQSGTLLAVCSVSNDLPPIEDGTAFNEPTRDPTRLEISWDNIVTGQPFEPWTWHANAEGNQTYTKQVSDEGTLYEHFIHPHWILSISNTALTRQYIMPSWIHVGSQIRHHAPIRVGDEITVQAVPVEKWRKKGHEFVRLLLHYRRGESLTTEVLHTAIFRIAGA